MDMLAVPCRAFGLEWTHWVHATGDRVVSPRIKRRGMWEIELSERVYHHLRPGDVFIDVGANIGWYTALASQCVGGTGRVIAIEPSSKNFQILTHNIEQNHWAQAVAINAAAGSEAGAVKLYEPLSQNLGDFRTWAAGNEHVDVGYSVAKQPIDQLLLDHDVAADRVRAIKMDCQGFEPDILTGMHQTFDSLAAGTGLLIEVWPGAWREQGLYWRDCLALLRDRTQVWLLDKGQNSWWQETWSEFDRRCESRYHSIKMTHKAFDVWFEKTSI